MGGRASGNEREKIRRRALLALGIVILILFVLGPLGYMLLEDMPFADAFYMTVITVFTVGFREVKELGTGGRAHTISIIIVGVSSLFFLISNLIEYTFLEALGETLGRRRMDLRIRRLSDHIVVCGYGRVGEVVCDTLDQAGTDFVLVEQDPTRYAEAVEKGYLAIQGDATLSATLEEAGVKRARGLVCALDSDANNLLTSLTARFLNRDLVIVARCVNPESVEKLRYAGADKIISPYTLSGKRMANFLLKPGVCDYLDLVTQGGEIEYRMEELLVQEGSPLAGKSIGEMDIKARTGALIVAVRKARDGSFNTNPDRDTKLDAGDLVIALGRERDLYLLEKLAGSA
ncbi:MAG: potassium channel protein [Candidatus Geothermincolales bacterium]